MRRILLLVSVLLFGFVAPAQAQTNDPIADAVNGLKGHTVYLAPNAGQNMNQDDVVRLERQIAQGRAAIIIAVLPESAGAQVGVDNLPHTLAIALGDPTAVVGVVSGRSFRAGAKAGAGLDQGEAGRFAGDAVKAHSPANEPLVSALSDWVTRVNNRVSGRPAGGSTSGSSSGGSDTDWGAIVKVIAIILASLLLVTILGFVVYGFYRRSKDKELLEDRRNSLQLVLQKVGGKVVDLEPQVKIATEVKAKQQYDIGVRNYQDAADKWSNLAEHDTLDQIEELLTAAKVAFRNTESWLAGVDPNPPLPPTPPAPVSRKRRSKKAKASAPPRDMEPTEVNVNVRNYGGTGYGYYPGYGWGYWGPNNDFVMGMLYADAINDDHHHHHHDEDHHDEERSYSSSSSSSDSGFGFGDWGSSSGGSDFGGSGDWGGGGDSGGGGGGDW